MAGSAEIRETSDRIEALRAQATGDSAWREALAAAMQAHAEALRADDRFDDARQAVHEAIGVLSPAFAAKPVVHEATMNVLVNDYLSLVRRTDAPVDEALLEPIALAQARLNGERDDASDGDGDGE